MNSFPGVAKFLYIFGTGKGTQGHFATELSPSPLSFCFETGSHWVSKTGIKLVILWLSLLNNWDYSHVPPTLVKLPLRNPWSPRLTRRTIYPGISWYLIKWVVRCPNFMESVFLFLISFAFESFFSVFFETNYYWNLICLKTSFSNQ